MRLVLTGPIIRRRLALCMAIFLGLFLLLNAKNGLRSSQSTSPKPVFLLFAQYLLRKQRKTSLVVVDKRGFFYGRVSQF